MADFIFVEDNPTNEERVAAAQAALERVDKYHPYRHRDGKGKWVIDADSITDLVADLLHLARQNGIEPDYIMETAKMNFDAEVEHDPEKCATDPMG